MSTRDYGYDPHILHHSSSHLPTFTVNDIQYINVAFNKNGIPLLPYSRSYSDSYPSPLSYSTSTIQSTYPSGRYTGGEVVSACRIVEDDPALQGGSHAVKNVWSAIQHHYPSSNISPREPYSA
jgi:hypothetical protein